MELTATTIFLVIGGVCFGHVLYDIVSAIVWRQAGYRRAWIKVKQEARE